MRILVDTSAWVDFINGYDSPEAAALAELIDREEDIATCGLVVAELFQGLTRPATAKELERLFADLSFLEPRGFETYLRAASVFRGLRKKGVTIRSTIDCILVCIAEEAAALLLAKDRDVAAIVDSGLTSVRAYPV